MSNPVMVSTIMRGLCLAHICSSCHFPAITIVTLKAEARKRYVFSASEAKSVTNSAANAAVNIVIRRINNLSNTKNVLEWFSEESAGAADSCHVHIFSEGSFNAYAICPHCGRIEPWLNPTLDKDIANKETKKLSSECFPTVFTDGEAATKWAEQIVRTKIAEIELQREDPKMVEQAATLFYKAKENIDLLNKRIRSIPGYLELETKRKQIQDLQTQKEKAGTFRFKEKKEIKQALEKLTHEEYALSYEVNKSKYPLDEELQKENVSLDQNQLIAFGCNPEIMIKKLFSSFTYYYVPNDPPFQPQPFAKKDDDPSANDLSTTDSERSVNIRKPVFCHKCGQRLLANSSFCSFCGAKLE